MATRVTPHGLNFRITFHPDVIPAGELRSFTIIENDMLNGEVIRLDGAIRLAPK